MQLQSFKNTTRGLWVGRGLVAIGFVIMCVLVYFQARHGWSMGTWIGDQIGFAVLHGVVDVATALLVSAGAICFAWHMRKMGWAACLFAVLLTCVSILWVSGFMSGRMTALAGQKAALDILEKHGKWAGGTTYKQADRNERRSLRLEMRENARQMVKVASVVPDPHALWLSNITGWGVEFCQRVLIAVSSSMAQAMKYICLLVGFFLLSNRDERNASGSRGNSDGNGGKVVTLHKPEPSTAALTAAPNSTAALAAASTRRSDRPVAPIMPVQLPWPKADVDAYLAEVAGRPKRQTWREMAHMMGWDHTTLFKRWQRSTGVNKGQRRPVLGGHRVQHRHGRDGGGLHAPI